AGRPSRFSCIAVARHAKAHSVVDASWNFDFDPLLVFDSACAIAGFTRISDDLSGAATVRTDGRHAEKASGLIDLALSLTRGAGFDPAARFGSQAIASFTRDVIDDRELFLGSPSSLLEADLHSRFLARPFSRTLFLFEATSTSTKEGVEDRFASAPRAAKSSHKGA